MSREIDIYIYIYISIEPASSHIPESAASTAAHHFLQYMQRHQVWKSLKLVLQESRREAAGANPSTIWLKKKSAEGSKAGQGGQAAEQGEAGQHFST